MLAAAGLGDAVGRRTGGVGKPPEPGGVASWADATGRRVHRGTVVRGEYARADSRWTGANGGW